jgi:hypothetical protein
VLGEGTRSVKGLEEALDLGSDGVNDEGWDKGLVVVELKRRKEFDIGCIRGKRVLVGRVRKGREARGAV